MTLRDDASGFKMVAATRKDKQFGGAAAMLLPSVRRRLAEMFGTGSLVFLPSSISEVIVVAQTAGEPEEHLAEQDWLKISHEIPQELRDVTDRFIRAVRVHACDQVDTAYLAGMRDMMKIAAAFGLYEIDPDDVLPARQRK